MRNRLRTLLIVLAVGPPAIAWMFAQKTVWRVPINGGQQVVVFKTSRFSHSNRRLRGNGESVETTIGNQQVRVDATQVKQLGGRTVSLPTSWTNAEVILRGNEFRVIIDGEPIK
jgi:hypothetical protein